MPFFCLEASLRAAQQLQTALCIAVICFRDQSHIRAANCGRLPALFAIFLQAQLDLSEMQQGKMIDARRRLLSRLKGIAERRRQIVSSLGLELLSCTRVRLPSVSLN